MTRLLKFLGQGLVYAIVAAGIGYFATQPVYRQISEDRAQIKLSFVHGAARQQECRRLTPQEIAKLPASERRPNTCSRERVAVRVQLDVDDRIVLDEILHPTGLSGDGPARIYRKFTVPSGGHLITAKLRDSRGSDGFNYETRRDVILTPGQSLAIDFKADAGGFIFR